jgi:hypothetical protein
MLKPHSMLLVLGCAAIGAGCNSILGLGDYKVSPDAGGIVPQGDSGSCAWDLDSGQCYPCAPQKDPEFLNSCTSSQCVPFDDTLRVPKANPDGSLPVVPDRPPDDAGTEAGGDAGKDSGPEAGDGGKG